MPQKSKNKFTLKIISGYLILGTLVVLAGMFIYSEFQTYSATQNQANSDIKLLRTNTLLTALYDAENQSKLALQNGKKRNFLAYAQKVDSITHSIEALKLMAKSENQVQKLDSVQQLLQQKVYNNAELRKLKEKDKNNAPLDSLLGAFNKIEADLGRITPESLVPNFDDLSAKAQQSLQEYVAILNQNIPKNSPENTTQDQIDSILHLSKSMIKDAKLERTKMEQSVLGKELQIYRADLELSQQLRSIISTFEQELVLDAYADNFSKQQLLKRSSNLAWLAAILGFVVIVVFTFLTVNDYWKGQLLQEQLEKEKQFSESLLKSREQLISTVSHDLRTPLNTIKGYAELLEPNAAVSVKKQYLKNLKSATNYVENLVNDLLDFSKLEAGKVHVQEEPYPLHTLLEEVAIGFEEKIKSTSIVYSLEVGEELKNPILGDSFRVKQIVTNLVENAFKFTSEGFIKVKALTEKNKGEPSIKIQVSDSGIGIEKDKQELIFKEFTQAKKAQQVYSGYGLGLTISSKLAQLLGGSLAVESKVGQGSTFTLTLPLTLPLGSNKSGAVNFTKQQNGEGLVVLDDDQTLLELIHEVCRIHGIACTTFSSFNAFSKAKHVKYALLLTDIEMPGMDGFHVISALREGIVAHYNNQPVLAMTGRREVSKNIYFEYGFSDVLLKPFSSKTFVSVIDKYLPTEDTELSGTSIKFETFNSFSLELISSFVQDKQSLDEVLGMFLSNTSQNLKELKKAIMAIDYSEIRAIAHKMLPMFRQLNVEGMLAQLEYLEHIGEDGLEDDLIKNLKSLKQSFAAVKKEMSVYLARPSVDIG